MRSCNVNMETNSTLLSINNLVPHTGVIGILDKLLAFQALSKLVVIQQTCNHHTVDRIHSFYQ
jgi:hypothetical protein